MPLCHSKFQSTLSVRRATIATPVLYCAERFQSTLSVRRATADQIRKLSHYFAFQSTLSVRRATLITAEAVITLKEISIHALREESDVDVVEPSKTYAEISIHALREESDLHIAIHTNAGGDFNPRSP